MPKQPGRRRTKKRRPDFFKKHGLLLSILAVAGVAVAGLILLARLQEQPPAPPVVQPVKKTPVDDTRGLYAEIDAFFASQEIDAGKIQRDFDQNPVRFTVTAEFPPANLVTGFEQRVAKLAGGYAVRYREANALTIEKNQRTRVLIHFLPPPPEFPEGPLMTVIMDDLGRSTATAKALLELPEPVTFAILPDEAKAVQVAEIAHAAGHEVMLHVPMEPHGFPATNPGDDALFVKYSDAVIKDRLETLLGRIPHVVGANNHMGSRFTEDARALAPVMQVMQEKRLFFVDSRTTGKSQVPEVAHRAGVPTLNRDVFLDNVADVEAIRHEIRRLEQKARTAGMAVGICHPYPETIEALRRELPGMAGRGVTVVPVSVLLRKQAAAQGS